MGGSGVMAIWDDVFWWPREKQYDMAPLLRPLVEMHGDATDRYILEKLFRREHNFVILDEEAFAS
jgi:hypothetical protein